VETGAVVKTLHPEDYNDVFYVGHYFREGTPVVMDLTSMTDEDARPLVDFAAGLVIGRGGTMERVATKVFLLLPAGTVGSQSQPRPAEVPR
jgi:cell division inhibitor SepF